MSLLVPFEGSSNFRTYYSNVNIRPVYQAAFGTSVTPGINNTMGSWTSLSLTATNACYGVKININNSAASNNARNLLVDIGIDPAGGTNYSVLLPYLSGCSAAPYGLNGGGHWYYFPIYIPAGSTVAARAQVNNATASTVSIAAWLFADPRYPEAIKYGHRCEAIGVATASSGGTAVTAGTTAEGSWTSLGNSTQNNFWWQVGFAINDSSMGGVAYACDLAADNNATTPKLLIVDAYYNNTSTEQLAGWPQLWPQNGTPVGSSITIYGRCQCSGTADSALSMIAYGVE